MQTMMPQTRSITREEWLSNLVIVWYINQPRGMLGWCTSWLSGITTLPRPQFQAWSAPPLLITSHSFKDITQQMKVFSYKSNRFCLSMYLSVCQNFLKGRRATLACSYRSTCQSLAIEMVFLLAVSKCKIKKGEQIHSSRIELAKIRINIGTICRYNGFSCVMLQP